MYLKTIFVTFIILFCMQLGFSQSQSSSNVYFTIPDIAILDIEKISDIVSFEFEAEDEAGDPLKEPDKNDKKWINYTTTAPLGGPYKSITAQISGPTFIPGLDIDLTVTEQKGDGIIGTPVGLIQLSTTAQTVVSGIGGAYTHDGTGDGHRLRYEVTLDYALFKAPLVPSCTIIYTFSN